MSNARTTAFSSPPAANACISTLENRCGSPRACTQRGQFRKEREEIVLPPAGKLRRPRLESVGRDGIRCGGLLPLVCGAVCRSGRHSERKTARGTQEAIGCGEHPRERGSEPLFFSPPSPDSLLLLESPRIGQVQYDINRPGQGI